ncbi:helix-turn-helix domain-containing protein [Clostridioides difficile]|nr:helix-turn-helix domain-containing protein [Clostridioides difficile]
MPYKPSEFAEKLGVSVKTLMRWDKDKKLVAFRTPTNRRYYTEEQYLKYIRDSGEKRILIFDCKDEIKSEKLRKYAKSIGCEEVDGT